MQRLVALVCLWGILLTPGCATYEPKVAPFKLPEAHANVQRIGGAYVASRAWPHEGEAKEAFGFNIIQAGLLPVQVSFDNRGNETLVIEPSQTYLINQQQDLFPVLSDEEAYDRVNRASRLPETVSGATKGAILGGATGALLGAAIGVVVGRGVGDAAARGAAAGGAAGAIMGGVAAADSPAPRTIAENLSRRNLKNLPIKPGDLAYGIILFPREAGTPQALRLQLKAKETGQVYTLILAL